MAKIKRKYERYWQYRYELVKDYELTAQQGVIYAYLYNHCINLNDYGYCGYSDQRMAEELGYSLRTFQRELKVLRDKGLIIIKNPQKRSKKAGQSRMIYINDDIYLLDNQLDLTDIQQDNLKRENERLQLKLKELEESLEQTKSQRKPNYWGIKLIKSGVISDTEYMKDCDFYNSLLNGFANATDPIWVEKAINYFSQVIKTKKIKHYPSYLNSAVTDSILSYQMQQATNKSITFGENGLERVDENEID